MHSQIWVTLIKCIMHIQKVTQIWQCQIVHAW